MVSASLTGHRESVLSLSCMQPGTGPPDLIPQRQKPRTREWPALSGVLALLDLHASRYDRASPVRTRRRCVVVIDDLGFRLRIDMPDAQLEPGAAARRVRCGACIQPEPVARLAIDHGLAALLDAGYRNGERVRAGATQRKRHGTRVRLQIGRRPSGVPRCRFRPWRRSSLGRRSPALPAWRPSPLPAPFLPKTLPGTWRPSSQLRRALCDAPRSTPVNAEAKASALPPLP